MCIKYLCLQICNLNLNIVYLQVLLVVLRRFLVLVLSFILQGIVPILGSISNHVVVQLKQNCRNVWSTEDVVVDVSYLLLVYQWKSWDSCYYSYYSALLSIYWSSRWYVCNHNATNGCLISIEHWRILWCGVAWNDVYG